MTKRLAGRAVLLCAIGAAALSAVAEAQDTEFTPEAKPVGSGAATQWSVLGGAAYGEGGEPVTETSPTPYTVDFFTTSFSPTYVGDENSPGNETGFFGGAQCTDPNTAFDDQALDDCAREPAIYRYRADDVGDPEIEAMDLPANGPGYIASIAWIDGERALAVGGSGDYPRREPPPADPEDNETADEAYLRQDREEYAGTARAWLYENGSWRELEGLPEEMGALTALDCAGPNLTRPSEGTCLAGGLQRMWWWSPLTPDDLDGFDEEHPVTPADTPAATPADTPAAGNLDGRFRYRVRQIRFSPDDSGGDRIVRAITSGCCSALGTSSGAARILVFSRDTKAWTSNSMEARNESLALGTVPAGPEDAGAVTREAVPDSYYALSGSGSTAIASPGGSPPASGEEPGSRIVRPGGAEVDVISHGLDSVRLLAGDGEKGSRLPGHDEVDGGDQSRQLPFWAVGGFKPGEHHQGVAYTTFGSAVPLPKPLTCTLNSVVFSLGPESAANCELNRDAGDYNLDSRRLVAMGTYALNSFSFVPGTDGRLAWSAGDRGAIARLGGAGGLGADVEPPAPHLPPSRPASLAERGPFEPLRPPSAAPGLVPPLAARPLEVLPEPTFVPFGTADPTRPLAQPRETISSIAMSRDGSEGWAVGSGPGYGAPTDSYSEGVDGLVLHHFDGERWVRCDATEFGDLPADEACASLRELADRTVPQGQNVKPAPAALWGVARIPLEQDDDPTNDDEFAAMGFGPPAGQVSKARVVMYRNGRWQVDETASTAIQTGVENASASIAFNRPDDGWLINSADSARTNLYHYANGEWPDGTWHRCRLGRTGSFDVDACGAGISRLPLGTGPNATWDSGPFRAQIAGSTLFAAGNRTVQGTSYPFVASKQMDSDAPWQVEYDPGCPESREHPPESTAPPTCSAPDTEAQGAVDALSVVELGDGTIAGWLVGSFGASVASSPDEAQAIAGPQGALMRRDPSGQWEVRTAPDAATDFLPQSKGGPSGLMSYVGADGGERSFILPASSLGRPRHPPLAYDPTSDRWEVLPVPFVSSPGFGDSFNASFATQGTLTAATPNAGGGFWATVRQGIQHPNGLEGDRSPEPHSPSYYYHYTDRRHRPVFDDVASPVSEPISGLDGTADGTIWVSTRSERLYRYDRLTGWERIRVPGWDPGRVVTRASSAYAVAVNDSGVGVVVGEEGRIADIERNAVALDRASGRRCTDGPPPCGTPQTLRSVDVAPDGSALVGGDRLTLMWRPGGGEFRLANTPSISVNARISAISMPEPGHAWLATNMGEIWAGTLSGTHWSWVRESTAAAAAADPEFAELNAIALDGSGRGLAVGDRGAMLERSEDGRWQRLDNGYLDDLYSIALPPTGYGDGTLVGGGIGLILTRSDGAYRVARHGDVFDPLSAGQGPRLAAAIVGLTIAGGQEPGDVEAWAASQVPVDTHSRRDPAPYGLLRYASGEDPLLYPEVRADPLPDTPTSIAGELTFAAFGRSECRLASRCPEFQGTNLSNEIVTRRIADEIGARRADGSEALTALFTGDINSGPGREQEYENATLVGMPNTPLGVNVTQERWRELIAEPLIEEGVPVLAAPGMRDLGRVSECLSASPSDCIDTQDAAPAGTTTQWSQTFSTMPAPWGTAEPYSADGYTYRPLESSAPADTSSATGEGANTHYALDVVNEATDQPVARLVFADTSNARSLTASDPNQNPVEPQSAWLEEVLCTEGSPTDAAAVDCTRPAGLPAVVVTTTPTYSYGPGGIDGTQTEGAAFEEILLRNKVTALITGHLGWNGLYYTHAPGLHSPEPGGEHPDSENPPSPPAGAAATGLLPTVVASSAGGRFGVDGSDDGEATEGYWHGYSVIRIPASGDPKDVVVEQRPILDWIGIEGQKHVLRPRQKLVLSGYGREPLGTDTSVRIDRIENEAVTHRFDLLAADPAEPWLPLTDQDAPTQADGPDPYLACGTYICLTEEVGTIDDQSGEVRAGSGRHNGAYALAVLSVGSKAATYPVYFEKSPSFKAAASPTPKLDLKVATPPAPPGVETPPVPSFQSPTFNAPNLPTAPTLALPLALASTPASPPQPPVPPPAAPANPGPSPLDLSFAPTGLTVAPTASVIPPPAPPIQPAPPGGARKEARQRQAAAQKSGADGAKSGAEGSGDSVDLADSPRQAEGAEMTRRDPGSARQEHSFTRLEHRSDGTSVPAIAAGLTLAALCALMASMTIPRGRSRGEVQPAPETARSRYR